MTEKEKVAKYLKDYWNNPDRATEYIDYEYNGHNYIIKHWEHWQLYTDTKSNTLFLGYFSDLDRVAKEVVAFDKERFLNHEMEILKKKHGEIVVNEIHRWKNSGFYGLVQFQTERMEHLENPHYILVTLSTQMKRKNMASTNPAIVLDYARVDKKGHFWHRPKKFVFDPFKDKDFKGLINLILRICKRANEITIN